MATKPIDCYFARAAIHHHTKLKFTHNNRLPKGSMATIIRNYNQQFSGYELTTSYTVATKKFLAITRTISNRRWHPTEAKEEFLTKFSPTAWKNLTE